MPIVYDPAEKIYLQDDVNFFQSVLCCKEEYDIYHDWVPLYVGVGRRVGVGNMLPQPQLCKVLQALFWGSWLTKSPQIN